MFIMFGWVKERKEVGQALTCHCYRCQRTRMWEHWKETEWVSFFTIKTIPFLSKSYLVCSACREPVAVDSARSRFIGSVANEQRLAAFLDEHQLALKTPVQRSYLLAQREQDQRCE
ncbi:hypothetical protein ACN9MY_22505 [Pseudoduganella sp. R-31]|uniref:hypothetical protein n=1 Tax=unclassified Pseudoduganella TaxID=2637179 RepID=UPI003CE670FE